VSVNELDGLVAIVTGGAGGLGRGIARRFVAEGARVVIADLNDARARSWQNHSARRRSSARSTWPTPTMSVT